MAPSHVLRISRNQAESAGMELILKFELHSGRNFKIISVVRMPLEYIEWSSNPPRTILVHSECINVRMQLECSRNIVGISRMLLECSQKRKNAVRMPFDFDSTAVRIVPVVLFECTSNAVRTHSECISNASRMETESASNISEFKWNAAQILRIPFECA